MSSRVATAERAVLVTVALGAILAPLNSTMIAVALPQIVTEFHTSVGTAGWLITAYLLALAVVQPVAGKLGDRYGRRPFILGGLCVFALASLGAALAQSLGVLIAFRVIQAISGAVVFPNGVGLVREVVPEERRARAFGIVGGVLALAAALGPPLGGLLIAVGGWQSIFYVNLPIVAATLGIAWRAVPRQWPRRPQTQFDWVGSLLFGAVLTGSAGLVIEGHQAGSPLVWVLGGLTLAAASAWFVRRELSHPDPVLQPRFFTLRSFSAASAGVALSNLGFYTLLLATPILLSRHTNWSSLRIGLALTLLSAPTVALAPIGGRLADRLGRRIPAVAGCVLLTIALVPLVIAPGIATAGLFACLAMAGAGTGLSAAAMQTAAVEAVDEREVGAAAGLYSTSRYIGSFAGSIALARLLDSGPELAGFRTVFAMALAGAALAVLATLALQAWPAAGASGEARQLSRSVDAGAPGPA